MSNFIYTALFFTCTMIGLAHQINVEALGVGLFGIYRMTWLTIAALFLLLRLIPDSTRTYEAWKIKREIAHDIGMIRMGLWRKDPELDQRLRELEFRLNTGEASPEFADRLEQWNGRKKA